MNTKVEEKGKKSGIGTIADPHPAQATKRERNTLHQR